MKMDRIDYTFKFSTELIVLALSFSVIALNIAGVEKLQAIASNNSFSKLLAHNPESNQALYDRATAVRTVVAYDSNFIPTASASAVFASTDAPNSNISAAEQSIIETNSIERPNPDSVRALIEAQIKVYDTKEGDALQSIANQHGISVNTIKWANNLTGDNIKPGWNLVILPTNGILHKVTNNDTLPDIAKKFNADINKIISYNNLLDQNDIEPGDLLIVPDGYVKAPTKPAIKNTVSGRDVYEPSSDEVMDGFSGPRHIFPWGQCTYYVATKMNIPWGGNAKNWPQNSKAYGAKFTKTPLVGSIAVTTENRRYGHVAYVEKVQGNQFLISEMNYAGLGRITYRWLSVNDPVLRGFITK